MYNQNAYALGTKGSMIRDIAEYGDARAAIVGADRVYNFTIGNPSIPTPHEVTQTIHDLLADTDTVTLHSYTPAIGLLQTRQAIADDLNARFGCGAKAEELFIGNGASSELCAVFQALTFPGAEFLAIAPYFTEYVPFVTSTGAAFKVVPADTEHFQIDMDALERMLNPNTAAIIINSPNNPAGTVYSQQTIEKLAALLTQKGALYGHPIYIVSDDPYRELVYDGVQVPFIPNFYPHTIVCYSYSKSLSLPGERIGYIYVPAQAADSKALYAAIAGAARGAGHICAPSFWQRVIARCAHIRPDMAVYAQNRKALYEGLLEAGYQVAKPDGAFYLFARVPGEKAADFARRAMKKDVLVVPGDDFGCPDYFRLCYCVKYETIVNSLPLFRELIGET